MPNLLTEQALSDLVMFSLVYVRSRTLNHFSPSYQTLWDKTQMILSMTGSESHSVLHPYLTPVLFPLSWSLCQVAPRGQSPSHPHSDQQLRPRHLLRLSAPPDCQPVSGLYSGAVARPRGRRLRSGRHPENICTVSARCASQMLNPQQVHPQMNI